MGIMKKKPTPTTDTPKASGKGQAAAGGLSIIGVGMTVRGDLESDGVVKVEGEVQGGIRATSQVLVAKGGVVHGDIETTDIVVGGAVDGAIRAAARVEVQAGASVQGDITTRRIFVAEGGSLNGQIRMGDAAEPVTLSATGSSRELRTAPAAHPSSVPVATMAMPPQAAGQGQSQ